MILIELGSNIMEKNFTKIIICYRINKALQNLTSVAGIKWISCCPKEDRLNTEFAYRITNPFLSKNGGNVELQNKNNKTIYFTGQIMCMDDLDSWEIFITECWRDIVDSKFIKDKTKQIRKGNMTYTLLDPYIQISNSNCSLPEEQLVNMSFYPKTLSFVIDRLLNAFEKNKETELFSKIIDDAMNSYGKNFVLVACVLNRLATTDVLVKDVIPLILRLFFLAQI